MKADILEIQSTYSAGRKERRKERKIIVTLLVSVNFMVREVRRASR